MTIDACVAIDSRAWVPGELWMYFQHLYPRVGTNTEIQSLKPNLVR